MADPMPRNPVLDDFYRGGPLHPDTNAREALSVAGTEYMRAGLDILALQGKVPHATYCPHGFKSPIETPEAWQKALADPNVTGVGIVCTPNLFVLDIDGPEGWEALHKLHIFPLDHPTAVTITSRGAHFWFLSATPVTSRGAGVRFLPHVDLKASGYVVAPPSLHPDGTRYRWKGASLVYDGFVYAADVPERLLAFLEDLEHREMSRGPSPYIEAARHDITPLVTHLRHSDAGGRNETLNWCALRAGTEGHGLQETLDAFLPVAIAIGLTPRESKATIKSGWKAGNEQRHG